LSSPGEACLPYRLLVLCPFPPYVRFN
jgi:hypothetical protein